MNPPGNIAAPPSRARRPRAWLFAFIFFAAALLLFWNLGHYALWDDEAGTSLTARGVLRTGDTSAVLGHNIVAYESGKDLINLRERQMPPLPAYFTAPFLGLLGSTAFTARLPFALSGLGCIALMLYWLWRLQTSNSSTIFFAAALLANVSFFLFCRQCRYYAVAICSSTALAFLYANFLASRHKTARLLAFTFFSLCLFASNYLNWAALYLCLGADYLIWGRRTIKLTVSDLLILILPQAVLGGIIFSIWNPLRILGSVQPYPVVNKLLYVWWNFRDSAVCEFGSPLLILLAILSSVAASRKSAVNTPPLSPITPTLTPALTPALDSQTTRPIPHPPTSSPQPSWLPRACLCLVLYIIAISLLVQRPPSLRGVAAVRYLTPIIPLCIAISTMTLAVLYARSRSLAVVLAIFVFSTNIFNGGPFSSTGFRSTILCYIRELIHPPPDPFTLTANWINQNISNHDSVWVVPDYATYPLMFHAPNPTYAWQLTWPPAKPEFQSLPPIYFIGRTVPKYIIAFGPATELAVQSIASLKQPRGHYTQIATIDCFWKDLYRPELFWRSFSPITDYDKTSDAIYVFSLNR